MYAEWYYPSAMPALAPMLAYPNASQPAMKTPYSYDLTDMAAPSGFPERGPRFPRSKKRSPSAFPQYGNPTPWLPTLPRGLSRAPYVPTGGLTGGASNR